MLTPSGHVIKLGDDGKDGEDVYGDMRTGLLFNVRKADSRLHVDRDSFAAAVYP
jgi:hypothetical protein